ncbi:MAG TPA: UDP-phosphate N-acetylglucosaminyl 1-phosphate transferase [Rhodobiaceae bacterium]|nr:UDP-phosphate N-acetylglucosaminyl 1-phosphate transferase [Rhodobiaceae bacterium]|tara:strand:+ start:5357 stop:6448 length:1092 start_codon:yes stop_codon:yes gene_type:complete
MLFGYEALVVFSCSLAGCLLLYWTKNFHLGRSARGHLGGAVQSAHSTPTPRIGGVAIGGALVVSLFFTPTSMLDNYSLFVISLTPVFLAGLADDLGYHVPPWSRLFAATLSSVLAVALLQMWVIRIDVPYVDGLIAYAPIGILLTIFATSGICHAFNLIDGLNGLSAGTGVIVAVGVASIGFNAGISDFATMSMLLIAALAGFLVFNFPFGKLFLGDAGAYSLGHILAWFAILLIDRRPEVTTWAVLLVFFWPVADTLFAIYRRSRAGRDLGQPDRLHYHQFVMRASEIVWLGRGKRHLANPIATLIMMPLISAPVLTGVILWDRPFLSFVWVLVYAALFVLSYQFGLRAVKHFRKVGEQDKN